MSALRLVYSSQRQVAALAEASDRELLERICERDELALDELVRRKAEPLTSLGLRYLGDREEAKDVVQLAFLRIWDSAERYDPRWSPNTWIYRITTNLAIDALRSRRGREARMTSGTEFDGQVPDRRWAADFTALEEREVESIFQELAADLTERQRGAFLLREVQGMSTAEAAEILGCRESTVRNHLFTARKHLRREINRRFPEYTRGLGDGEGEAS